jgi:hypothetical protein
MKKQIRQILMMVGCAMFWAIGYSVETPDTSRVEAKYMWTGAWQPTRISAGDGITALDTKIGKSINLANADEYAQVIFNVNNRFPGSKPWTTWAVGDMSRLTPKHQALSEREHEEYLTHMDRLGVTVFLEIFPSRKTKTDVLAEIDQWLNKFKHHPSVVGLGIELEYFGKASDEQAKAWDEKVKSIDPRYRLFLRHYSPDHMPPTYRGNGDLIFVCHSSEATIEELNKGFADWADRFFPTAVAFQIGYPADEDGMNGSNELGWWKLKDPIRDWGTSILPLIKHPQQELGLIWVTAKSGKTYNTQWDLTKGAQVPQAAK